MLILSRKSGEVITIGEDVKIRVIAISDTQVKLGIEAPKEMKIYRAEIYEQIQQQNLKATKTSKMSAARAAGLLGAKKPSEKS